MSATLVLLAAWSRHNALLRSERIMILDGKKRLIIYCGALRFFGNGSPGQEIGLGASPLKHLAVVDGRNAVAPICPLGRSSCSSELFLRLPFILGPVSIHGPQKSHRNCIPPKLFVGIALLG